MLLVVFLDGSLDATLLLGWIGEMFETTSYMYLLSCYSILFGTAGGFPYPSVANEQLLAYLQSGNRLAKPDGCNHDV